LIQRPQLRDPFAKIVMNDPPTDSASVKLLSLRV
jgi:hypothetical protein